MRTDSMPLEEDEDQEKEEPMLGVDDVILERSAEERQKDSEKAVKDVLGDVLQEFEAQCKKGSEVDLSKLDTITQHIVQVTRVNKEAAIRAIFPILQMLYEEWQLFALKSKKKAESTIVREEDVFGAMFGKLLTICFPVTDFRHPICTPLSLWISATLSQDSIHSLRHLSLQLFRLTLVLEMVSEAKRFSQEAIVLMCNLLTLTGDAKKKANFQTGVTGGFERKNPWLPLTIVEISVTPGLLHISKKEAEVLPAPVATNGMQHEDNDAQFGDNCIPALHLKQLLFTEPCNRFELCPSFPSTNGAFIDRMDTIVPLTTYHPYHQPYPKYTYTCTQNVLGSCVRGVGGRCVAT